MEGSFTIETEGEEINVKKSKFLIGPINFEIFVFFSLFGSTTKKKEKITPPYIYIYIYIYDFLLEALTDCLSLKSKW